MLEQQFQPCITGPSRILDYNSPSLIDNIFIHNITNPISGNILEKISFDHLPNFISFKAKNPKPTHTRFNIRDMSKFDSTKFREDLQAIDLLDYPHLNTDELASLFHKHFMESYNLHAPVKILSKKASKTKLKPWLTKGILKSINVKRSLLKKYDRSKNNSFLTKYRQYRHLLKKLIKKSKKNYNKIFFSENANNIKKTWKQLNNILNKHKKNQQISQLSINGTLISDQKVIANKFNSYFTNVAYELNKNIPKSNNIYQDYLKNPNEHSFYVNETNPHEISQIINDLKNSSAADIYDITTKFVKLASSSITRNLAILFNRSINGGIFPQLFKIVKVVPLFKNDSPLTVNYTPISLLPVISKIFERLMYNRLISFINKYNIITPNQYGFQAQKSTELAINEICNNINKTLENKESAFCIFLDFAKAFDTVNHNILLNKLEYYGIRGSPLLWFKSYLNNRQQYTDINGTLSNVEAIKCGVPQGSILGPLLFILYINDIVHSSNTHFICRRYHNILLQ